MPSDHSAVWVDDSRRSCHDDRYHLSRLKQGSSIPLFLQTTAEFGGEKKQYRE
jgi:hypothetical protein